MALGDHYQLTQRGVVIETTHPVENVWVYEQIAGGGNYNDFALAWLDDIWPSYQALSNNHYRLNEIYIVNLDNLDDFGTVAVDEVGSVDSAGLPSYDTWGFKLTRTTRAVQNGRKFVGLIAETDQDNGLPTVGAVTRLTAMEIKLIANISYPLDDAIYAPRIWRRPGTYADGTVSAPGLFYPIGSAAFTKITTMKTRDDR